jgi:hypothetical protein
VPSRASRQTDPRAGIENARKAGIKVDPAAEADMARAPIGSCGNDPTLEGCPPAHAYVHVDVGPDGSYELTPPASTATATTARASTAKKKVRALASAGPMCTLRASVPYRAAGYAQADATHECYSNITRHELYGQLKKWYDGQWVNMETGFSWHDGPGKIETHPRYRCVKLDVWRNWRHVASSYTNLYGTWYAASKEHEDQFQCG